jgi:hypothetical protein
MGGWYAAHGIYVPEELDGLPVEKFCEALRAEGVSCSSGANLLMHLHPVLNDADVQVSVPGMLNYYTAAGIDDVVSFYKNQLPAAGWTFDDDLDMVVDGSAILTFYQGNAQLSVLINREDDGRVNVTLMMESN